MEYTLLTSETTFCISIVNSLGFGRTAEKGMAFFPQLLPMRCLKSHHSPGLREIKRMLLEISSSYFAFLPKGNKLNPSMPKNTAVVIISSPLKCKGKHINKANNEKMNQMNLIWIIQVLCQSIPKYRQNMFFKHNFYILLLSLSSHNLFFAVALCLGSEPWTGFSQSSFSNK